MTHTNQASTLSHAIKSALYARHTSSLALCSLALVSSLVADPAFAQQDGSEGVLEEVVVTARKREELLTDVPVSISALTSKAIEDAGITNLTELFAIIPGVENNADGSRQADKPAIRGVGSQENATIRAKVTSFIDGIPLLGSQGIGSFAGLDHVEVLRGPQSAAFGRSTFGGAINYVTRNPGEEFELNLRASFANDSFRDLSAVISGPVVADHLGLIVTLQEKNYGGDDDWVTNLGYQLGATNDKTATIKLTFDAGDNVSGSLMYMRTEVDDGEPPIQFAALSQYQPHPDDPDGKCALNGGGNSCVILGRVNNGLVPLVFEYDYNDAQNPILNPGTRITRNRYQGSLSAGFGDGYQLTVLGAYTDDVAENWFDRDTFDLSGMSTIHAAATPETTEKYGEVRLASPDGTRLNWLVGASIYDYDYINTVYNNYTANIVMDLFAESGNNVGAFFNLGYDFNDRLTGSFEGRYQSDDISGVYPANPGRGAPEPISVSKKTNSFQPRLALTYAISDSTNLYGQVARGTNPAGFNVNALDPVLQATAASESYDLDEFVAFDEEEIVNFEIGLKGGSQDKAFRYSAALYYLDWTGYVQPVTGNWTPDDGVLLPGTTSNDYFSRLFVNTGDLDGLGVEFEAAWSPSENWLFGGALSYSGLEFKKDSCSPVPLNYGVPAIRTEPYACADVGGKKPPMFSPFTLALNGTYSHPLSAELDGYVRVDYAYRSKRYTEQINTDYIGAFNMVDLRFGVRADHWSAELFATNLLDDDTPSGAVAFFDGRQPGMVFGTSYVLRQPRSIGIRLAYNF